MRLRHGWIMRRLCSRALGRSTRPAGYARLVNNPDAFESIVGALEYPMLVATTVAGDARSGCLVGFATQCSIHPPRYLVCVSDKNHTYRTLEAGARAIAVHVVPESAADLVELFGGETGDDEDKFARCAWSPGPDGLPVLARAVRRPSRIRRPGVPVLACEGHPAGARGVIDAELGDEDYCYLTTTGRISGEPRQIEIWFAVEGDTLYMLSGGGDRSNWVRNLMREPTVTVRIRDRTLHGRARPVEPGTEEDALARRLLPEKYAPRYSGDLEDWRRRALPIAVDLQAG